MGWSSQIVVMATTQSIISAGKRVSRAADFFCTSAGGVREKRQTSHCARKRSKVRDNASQARYTDRITFMG